MKNTEWLDKQKRGDKMAHIRLGELLIDAGVINETQLGEALAIQKQTRNRLGDILIENNFITNDELIDALQMQLGIDFVDLTAISVPVELAKFIPRATAKKHCVVPVKLVGDTLYIAMADPLDFIAQEEVKLVSKKKVIPMIATRKACEQVIETLYGSEGTARAIEDMKREMGDRGGDIVPAQLRQSAENDANAAPAIRFVNSVIERAITEKASDVHLEPHKDEMLVRMRIDGVLRKILTVPSNLQNTVISRLKVMGGMNISEHKIPQDGHSMINVKGISADLRLSVMPTVYGEKMVIRILEQSKGKITKKSIGLMDEDEVKYDTLLKNSNGVILLVGPTGSGKSTTLCAMLTQLASEDVNIITLEDPVEYEIEGVNQCQINEKTGMTFASGLTAILRQDPDIIGVGEIRDAKTAQIAMRAAITGHLVLSTLHTNDAVSAIDRLSDIGIEPYMTSAALKGVISQRLVRKICPNCKQAYTPDADEMKALGIESAAGVQFYRGTGCAECRHTGYNGRQAVFEILTITKEMRRAIAKGASSEEILPIALQGNFESMKRACAKLTLKGITTAEEAIKAVNSTVE